MKNCKLFLYNNEEKSDKISQFNSTRQMLDKMTSFRNMLTDNKNINFGKVRAKYFNSVLKPKFTDIGRMQSLFFMKK